MPSFLLPGSAGNIEVFIDVPEKGKPISTHVIICHPHPLFGGTMHNKVVATLARTFKEFGLRTVRFNFRGVGQSAGIHDEGRGETADTIVVAEFLKLLFPEESLWLAGFSFGSFVAASAAAKLPAQRLICVAPQVSRFLSPKLPSITCPWLIIQGEQDEIIPPEAVYAWVETLQPRPQLIRVPDAGHFFHGKLLLLRQLLNDNNSQLH